MKRVAFHPSRCYSEMIIALIFWLRCLKAERSLFELEFDIKKMSRLQRSTTKARESTVNMPRAMEAQQYCTFNYNEHLCVLQTQAISSTIICQLLVSGQRCSIWQDRSFTLRAFALAKEENKTVRKAANTSLKSAFIEDFCYWYSSVPEYFLFFC